MKRVSSWKLPIALAVLAGFAAFVAWPGAGPRVVEADIAAGAVVSNVDSFSSGSSAQITVTGQDFDGDLTVSAPGATLTLVSCNVAADAGDCSASVSGSPSAAITVDSTGADGNATADPLTLVLNLTDTCSRVADITVTGAQDATSRNISVICLGDPQARVEKQADDNGHYDFDWDASGGNCALVVEGDFVEFDDAGSFDLQNNDRADFYCENPVNLTVDEADNFDFVAIDDCDEGDPGIDDISGSSILFDVSELGSSGTVRCTFVNSEITPTPTVVIGPATYVSIVLSAPVINCGGSTLVQVLPRNASGGPAAAGTTISVTSSLGGEFQPASSVTSAFDVGLATFLYTAPVNANGVTTITARAGNVIATAAVQIVCQVAPATAVPTSPSLAPPSAGNGGLLDSSGPNYLPEVLAIVAAVIGLSTVAVTRWRLRRR
jgi:hypothetical protein